MGLKFISLCLVFVKTNTKNNEVEVVVREDFFDYPVMHVPIGRKLFWEPDLERCRKRLAIWNSNYLSFGGRITLIKAALNNLPIYYLFLFKIQKG